MARDPQLHNENQFAGLGENLVVTPDFRTTKVVFTPKKGLLWEYVRNEYQSLNMVQGAKVPDEAYLEQYLSILLKFRVDYVNNVRLPFPPKDTEFYIPAFFSEILNCIGRVVSEEFGVILEPEYEVTFKTKVNTGNRDAAGKPIYEDRDMSIDDMFVEATGLSRRFKPFFDAAKIVCASVLPKSRNGQLSFMGLQMVENCVWGESNAIPPVYALMAAILHSEQAKAVLLPRVSYGSLKYLTPHIYRIGDYERSK